MKRLGERIKQKRDIQRIPMGELARRAGISASELSQIEKAKQLQQHLLTDIQYDNLNDCIEELYQSQLNSWPLVADNYRNLQKTLKRTLLFGNFSVDIQHNPGRVRSTCAKTQEGHIKERPCFLCAENLPAEQKGLLILERYLLLINPYPIFSRHLTISDINHTPQLIHNRISDILKLSKKLNNYTLFYNGPGCGASAPDHFHFQAVPKNALPVDREYEQLLKHNSRCLKQDKNGAIYMIDSFLRECVIFESDNIKWVEENFNHILTKCFLNEGGQEPMINVLANFCCGTFRLFLFPRAAQRPLFFYKTGNDKIVVSPASVEMGGTIITPRKEDFEKITKQDVIRIFEEVSYSISL